MNKADFHEFYSFLDELARMSNGSLVVYKSNHAKFRGDSNFINFILTIIDPIFYIIFLIRNRERLVIVREFINHLSIFYCLLGVIFGRNILLNINHNLMSTRGSLVLGLTKKFMRTCNCKFILFEGSKLTVDQCLNNVFFPFIGSGRPRGRISNAVRIGFVGSARNGKGVLSAVEKIKLLERSIDTSGVDFVFATDDAEFLRQLPDHWIKICTISFASYVSSLNLLDVAIFCYQRSDYQYRSSGVIFDCLQNFCIPIVPDYPLLSNQVHYPVEVGFTYTTDEQLINSVGAAIHLIKERKLEGLIEDYRAGRSLNALFDSFQRSLQKFNIYL